MIKSVYILRILFLLYVVGVLKKLKTYQNEKISSVHSIKSHNIDTWSAIGETLMILNLYSAAEDALIDLLYHFGILL